MPKVIILEFARVHATLRKRARVPLFVAQLCLHNVCSCQIVPFQIYLT